LTTEFPTILTRISPDGIKMSMSKSGWEYWIITRRVATSIWRYWRLKSSLPECGKVYPIQQVDGIASRLEFWGSIFTQYSVGVLNLRSNRWWYGLPRQNASCLSLRAENRYVGAMSGANHD
jgi:hypothetical protein